jgi:uncharacterized membrane protein
VTALALLAVSGALFVGTHFAMSHPLRAGMVRMLGERGFLFAYVAVSLTTFYGISRFYGPASAEAPGLVWTAGDAAWIAATLLMWAGSVLFVGSLRRNPAFPTGRAAPTRIAAPRGVFAITRHPMMWGFAVWAIVHAVVNATPASLVVSATILMLALGGAAGQDAKKLKSIGAPWAEWRRATAFVPFGRGLALPDAFALLGGTLLWLGATYAHGALGHRPAGVWAFFA